MTTAEARALLSIYRPGIDHVSDPRFAEALALAQSDPELAAWLVREQVSEAALREKLGAMPVPPGLKDKLLALDRIVVPAPNRWRQVWLPALAGAAVAAAVTLLASLAFLRSAVTPPVPPRVAEETPAASPTPAPPRLAATTPVPSATATPSPVAEETPAPSPTFAPSSVAKETPAPSPTLSLPPKAEPESLDHFREEMVSFTDISPPVTYMSPDADKLRDYFEHQQDLVDLKLPAGLARLRGKGCRTLSFRGKSVALICFFRKNGQLINLLVVDQSAIAPFSGTRDRPVVRTEGEWVTAAWTEDGLVYMMTVKGEKSLLNHYLKST